MKSFTDFIIEEDDDTSDAKQGLQMTIMSHLNRLAASDSGDRGILLLNAALAMLATGDDPQTISSVKRLIQLAVKPKPKKDKKEKKNVE